MATKHVVARVIAIQLNGTGSWLLFSLIAIGSPAYSGDPITPERPSGQRTADTAACRQNAVERAMAEGTDQMQRGDPERAVATIKRALAVDPRCGLAHQLLAQAYLQQGTYETLSEARAELRQAVALDPTLVWARFHLARLYLDVGAADKAHEQLNAAVDLHPDLPHVQSLLGEAERQLGHPRRSVERQKRALALDATFAPAKYYLGLAYLDLEDEVAALPQLEAAAASGLPIAELYLTLGSVHEDARRLDRARVLYERAVAVAADRPEAHMRLARVLTRQGHAVRALDALARALPDGRRLPTTQYYQRLEAMIQLERGRALQVLGQWNDAARAYHEAVSISPDLGEGHRSLAEALYRQGNFSRALEHAERAAALDHPVPSELMRQITARVRR
ncbi:MAG: tetratricopeptide repeat protein [Luteitalea sp.]|nr:tetratricopeptide repeat protein [Luteitalea sp.]